MQLRCYFDWRRLFYDWPNLFSGRILKQNAILKLWCRFLIIGGKHTHTRTVCFCVRCSFLPVCEVVLA